MLWIPNQERRVSMPNCPRCSHDICVKAGKIISRQRYKCKACNYHYTVLDRDTHKARKRQALMLYLEGLGFRSIGRLLNVSHVSIYNWIKAFGQTLDKIKSSAEIEVVEMDEIHTYISHKKTTAGYGLLLIGLDEGSSTALLVQGARSQAKRYGKH